MAIPIVFVHKTDPFYLKYTLKQAKFFNPKSKIYLLGDDTNNHYSFVTHVPLNKYQRNATTFSSSYKHRSTNNYNYELFCFERWFYIKDFLEDFDIDSFIYLDSDVLAFYDFSKITPLLNEIKIANTGVGYGMPAFTYFNSISSVNNFCDYLLEYYSKESLIHELDNWHESFLLNIGTAGGVCDMTIFDLFFKLYPSETKKIDLLGGLGFDVFIRQTDGYEKQGDQKKIYWLNNLPYCKLLITNNLVQFATLHYQGHSKYQIATHYRGGGFLIQRIIDFVNLYYRRSIWYKIVKKIGSLK
jgi:hypothetical protein